MRAARLHAHGPPEQIAIEELPDPLPRSGEVVVEIRAASVNYPDVLIAANRYQVSVPAPLTPGSEFAGVVCAVGSGVTDLAIGDEVCGAALSGAFADRIALAASRLTRKPKALSFEEAASFGVVYRTAFIALRVAGARREEWVVALGAAGGVGSATIEVAKRLGCRVLAIASSEPKLTACRAWGADAVLRSDAPDLKTRIRELTGEGADVVIDPVGGSLSEQALRALRWGGRFVVVGFASGEIPRIPLNLVLLKGIQIRSVDVRALGEREPEVMRRDSDALLALVEAGLRPRIGARYALSEVALALRAVADRRAIGKVVLTTG